MNLSFDQLGLDPALMQAVAQLGYEQPTPIQQAAIPALLNGQNVVGQAQTGTGKTAAFALPMLQAIQPGAGFIQALVLAPTRELAMQVAEAIQSMAQGTSVKVIAVYGGQSYDIQIRQLKRGVDVVVATPGRLLDLIEKKLLDLSKVGYLVVDEADEMLEMGFIDDVDTILSHLPEERQTALFSATMPDAVRKLADKYIVAAFPININPTRRTVDDTEQSLVFVRESDKLPALVRLLETEQVTSALIFARTKLRCQELADELIRRGYPAEALHGDLSQARRETVLNRFRQNSVTLLVATDVAARGLDIDNISHVFNYDVPQDSDDYVHRIGRTGRAGRKGVAITMLSPRERSRRSIIESYTRQPIRERALPGLDEIIARRDGELVQKVEDQMIRADHDRERELIARMVQTGYDPLEIASAALKLARAVEKALPMEHIEPVVFEPRRKRVAGEENARYPRKENSSSASRSERYGRSETRSGDRGEKPRRSTSEPAGTYEPRRGKSYADGKAASKHGKDGEPGYIRLWMNLGEMHGLRPKDVVGAIAGEVGIPGKAIGEIAIHRDHTFVDVSEKHVRQVLRESIGKYMLRGQPVTLKLA